jgi:hypothetical protein
MQGALAIDSHMRRQKTTKDTLWRRLEARLNMYRLHASLLFEEVSLRATNIIPTFDPEETQPAAAALIARAQWKMPIGPVLHLIRWLEAAGCIIIEEDFGTTRVDGLSQWIGDHPVILINSGLVTDRKRLTLARELGHLCLHSSIATADMEEEANAFAAEFLMPEHVIRPELRNLSLGKLIDLKREWEFLCKLSSSAPTVLGSSSRVIARNFTSRSICEDGKFASRPVMNFLLNAQSSHKKLARGCVSED